MKRKQRRHKFTITIVTDKPCTQRVALRELRDNLYGDFYCQQYEDGEPELLKVTSFSKIKQPQKWRP